MALIYIANNNIWISRIDQNALGWFFVIVCFYACVNIIFLSIKHRYYVKVDYLLFSILAILVWIYLRQNDQIFFYKLFGRIAYFDAILLPASTQIILCFILSKKKPVNNIDNSYFVLTDDPIEEEEADSLGFRPLVEALIQDIKHTNLSNSAFSIGVVGKWGQGKSSFINILTTEIKDEYILVKFNPRNTSNYQSIGNEFFANFAEVLHPYQFQIKSKIKRYAAALQIALEDNIAGNFLAAIRKLSPTNDKESINSAIRKIGKRILVVVDDLDRLTAPEILEVLKLIDRNADFVNTVFITAYDKDYINTVLKNYLGYEKEFFSDKYFNYELSLPISNNDGLYQEAANCIEKIAQDEVKDLVMNLWNSRGYEYVRYFGNVRNIKRFFNIFLSRYRQVYGDVNIEDFFCLTLIRYFDINSYNDLANGKYIIKESAITGNPNLLHVQDDFEKQLNEGHWEYTPELIKKLFLGKDYKYVNSYHRIFDINEFDNYFYDFKSYRLYSRQLDKLLDEDDEENAITLLNEYFLKDEIHLNRYLGNIPTSEFTSYKRLKRYIHILLEYTRCLKQNGRESILRKIIDPIKDDLYASYKEALGIIEMSKYKEFMLIMYDIFSPYYAYELQQLFQYAYNEDNAYNTIFSDQELVVQELSYQKSFMDNYDSRINDIGDVFNVSRITKKSDGKYDSQASRNLLHFMLEHVDEVAQSIFQVHLQDGKVFLSIVQYCRDYPNWFPIDNVTFESWTHGISDPALKQLIQKLIAIPGLSFSVTTLEEEYPSNNYSAILEAVKNDEDQKDIAKINNAIADENVYDLTTLSRAISLNKQRISELASSSKKNGLNLSPRYLSDMEPFSVGDIVKLTTKEWEHIQRISHIRVNLFKIENKDDNGTFMLSGLGSSFNQKYILPVLVNSNEDQGIYYDPIIAASIIKPGEAVPVYHRNTSYYLNSLQNSYDVNRKSYYDIITENKIPYVHEVQHLLRDGGQDDGLKIRKI